MGQTVVLKTVGKVSLLEIDNPPVNAISRAVVEGLDAALREYETSGTLGLVICATGRTFVAGGDIADFESPDFSASAFNDILLRIENGDRPVVAAVHGTVLGGGLELAMACHHRISTQDCRFGMPEIKLGLIPGSHGTQRLPRLVGLRQAAEMMMRGSMVGAVDALDFGLVDDLVSPEKLRDAAIDAFTKLAADPIRRTSAQSISDDGADALAGLEKLAAKRSSEAAFAALSGALIAARDLPFEQGIDMEAQLFDRLVTSAQSKAQRYLFFAERGAARVPGVDAVSVRKIETVGVLGVGTMGAGIAVAALLAGYLVTISEADDELLQAGVGRINATLDGLVKKGRLTEGQHQKCRTMLHKGVGPAALSDVDIVIEAVFEDMDLKRRVAAELGKYCKPGAIIATNTSTLDVNEIARASGRPEDVVGTHFFSPAHIMKLLEVVRGNATATEVLAATLKFARRIEKTVVVSGVCYGFIGNRMAEVYMRENEAMQLEGATPAEIDAVAQDPDLWGMAMGPNRMLDMAGVDVGARTVIEWMASGDGPTDPAYRILCRRMFEAGLHGQKTGKGYYLYEGRSASPNPAVHALATQLAKDFNFTRSAPPSRQEIFERLLFPLINEAAHILDEKIAARASDIDVVWTSGYGFPKWRGGPLWMADDIGLGKIVERLEFYDARADNNWNISPLLRKLAASGDRLSSVG